MNYIRNIRRLMFKAELQLWFMTQILVFGDSIAYGAWDREGGWVQRLRRFLEKKMASDQEVSYAVYNCGVSGDTTADLLKRFEVECYARYHESVEIYKESFIVFFSIGMNDTQFLNNKASIRISKDEFKNNIKKLIELARKFTSNIIFVGFQPIEESKVSPLPWNRNISYKYDYVEMYDKIVQSICKETNLPFIDIFNQFSKTDYKKLLEDGVHPNSEGHKKIFEIVKEFLVKNKMI